MATRERPGIAAFRNCIRFAANSDETNVTPVTLPPGLAKLEISPDCTGSKLAAITMGIVFVAVMTNGAHVPAEREDDIGLEGDELVRKAG